MTQIRGRIKTVVDYGDKLPGVTGTCCDSNGNKTVKTFIECNRQSGYFIAGPPESVTCPDVSALGFCCACPYTTKNTGTDADFMHPDHAFAQGVGSRFASGDGIRSGITQCECDFVGGNWTPTASFDDSEFGRTQLCQADGIDERFDARTPYSCCHCVTDDSGATYRDCSNVCSSRECLDLFLEYEGQDENCESEFDVSRICDYDTFAGRQPKVCPEAPPQGFAPPEGRVAEIVIPEGEDASACCKISDDGKRFLCSYETRSECERINGLYNIPDEGGPIACSSSLCPEPPTVFKNGFVVPPTIKSSDLPEAGSVFAGGVYMGTFTPGISEVLANVETGATPFTKASTMAGPGDKTSWALIMCPSDLGSEFGLIDITYAYLNTSEKPMDETSSLSDGLYNTYGDNTQKKLPQTDLYRQVRNYNRFGFKDWYIPSIDELGFIAGVQRDLTFGRNLNRYSQNHSKIQSNLPYMSSTRKNRSFKRKSQEKVKQYPAANLVYGLLVGNTLGPMNGYTFLSGLDSRFRVRLVRRIKVED